MEINPQSITNLLAKNNGLTFSQICSLLKARGKQKDQLKVLLKKLIQDKKVIRGKNKQYFAYTQHQEDEFRIGRIEIHQDGFGFCIAENREFDDVFIPKKFIRKANHLDLVKVQVLPSRFGKKEEGVVVEVIDESDRIWMGVVFPFENQWYFTPWGRRVQYLLPDDKNFDFQEDDIVLAQIEKTDQDYVKVHIKKVLGNIDDPKIDTDLLIFEHELSTEFSKATLEDANKTYPDACQKIRKDLTHLGFVTIDGEDAKDFDDAVFMDDQNHLWVAIADVSAYVKVGTSIDLEACDRANSFYFPDKVLPMLPEVLSNGLCSLRPFEKKFVMVVEMSFNNHLEPILEQVTPAIIESKARLTYTAVDQGLENPEKFGSEYKNSLLKLHQFTQKLYQKRIDNGAIDFNMPDVRFFPDDPTPHVVDRTRAHQLIEECMLCANQVTSKYVDEQASDNIYRVHEEADPLKLKDAVEILSRMLKQEHAYDTPQNGFDIQDILEDVKDHPNHTQIQYLFLRAMSQARYDTERLGHFGLGFKHYSHFTSPIRRYSDLILHRMIKNILLKTHEPLFPKSYQTLNNVCVHISKQDRKSLMIERDMKKIKGIRYMHDKIGETLDGSIAGILPRGIFVETFPFGIEGFVTAKHLQVRGFRYDSMHNQFVNPKMKLAYGSMLKVIVKQTNLFKRQLDFEIEKVL